MISKILNKKTKFIKELPTHELSVDLLKGWAYETGSYDPFKFRKRKNGVGALYVHLLPAISGKFPDIEAYFKMRDLKIEAMKQYQVKKWTIYESCGKSDE